MGAAAAPVLGEPLLDDVHYPYRPNEADGVDALRRSFGDTRAETVDLGHTWLEAGVDPTTTVHHTDLGDLSVAGWLVYRLQHPEPESRGRLRH